MGDGHSQQFGPLNLNHVSPSTRVLQNDLVLRCIFKFLQLPDLKICRRVNRQWKSASEWLFKNKAKLYFDFHDCDIEGCILALKNCNSTKNFDCVPKDIMELNPHVNCEIPFDSLRLRGHLPWSESDHCKLFEQEKSLRTLSIQKISFLHKSSQEPCRIDFLPPNLNTLNLSTNCSIPLELLSSIETVNIFNSSILLKESKKISPKELNLAFVSFFLDGNPITEILINDLIDFSKMENLFLGRFDPETDISIDLSQDVHSVATLSLDSVKILNWESSQWNVGKLILNSLPFHTKNEMVIKNLEIVSSCVDFSTLPTSLEKLSLCFTEIMETEETEVKNLPKLNYVELKDWNPRGIDQRIVYDLKNFNLHPNNIRTMELQHVYFTGEQTIHLDTLILHRYTIDDIPDWRKHFKPLHLIIRTKIESPLADRLVSTLSEQNASYNCITLGKFKWADEDFSSTNFSKIADRKASFYTFRNSFGRGMEKEQFEKLLRDLKN